MKQRCFPLPPATRPEPLQHPLRCFLDQNPCLSDGLDPVQQQALARLVPLLLCGEQSAVHVFHHESARASESLAYLNRIEADERLHEIALQQLLEALPEYQGLHRLKRQAQVFYAAIQQAGDSVARHFYMISQLDACVCVLMHAVARSSLQGSVAAQLFTLIKQDEARHVSIARQHAQSLQADIEQQPDGFALHARLVTLLQQQEAAFTALDIDSRALFSRLQGMARVRLQEAG